MPHKKKSRNGRTKSSKDSGQKDKFDPEGREENAEDKKSEHTSTVIENKKENIGSEDTTLELDESGFDTDADSGKKMDKTNSERTEVDKVKEWKNFLQNNHMEEEDMPLEYFKNLQSMANMDVNQTKKKSKVIV